MLRLRRQAAEKGEEGPPSRLAGGTLEVNAPGEPVEVHEMAVDHYSMLVPPAVAGLADRLRSCIERSLAVAPRALDSPPVAFVPQALEARS